MKNVFNFFVKLKTEVLNNQQGKGVINIFKTKTVYVLNRIV